MSDMGWSEHCRGQEDNAMGQFLVQCIAEWCGLSGNEADIQRRIDKAVYKGTDCGAWVRFDEFGIRVGTIVEGSDAEWGEHIDLTGIDIDEEGASLLKERFGAAIQRCEDFAEEHFGQEEDE